MERSSTSNDDTTELPAKVEVEVLPPSIRFAQLIAAPLYVPIGLKFRTSNAELRALRAYDQAWDMYCPDCGERSTFWAVVSADFQQRLKAEKLEGAIPATAGVGHQAQRSSGEGDEASGV